MISRLVSGKDKVSVAYEALHILVPFCLWPHLHLLSSLCHFPIPASCTLTGVCLPRGCELGVPFPGRGPGRLPARYPHSSLASLLQAFPYCYLLPEAFLGHLIRNHNSLLSTRSNHYSPSSFIFILHIFQHLMVHLVLHLSYILTVSLF